MAPEAPERDPGLQPERTRLAWRRTTLACVVTVLLAARQVIVSGVHSAAEILLVGLVVVTGLSFLGTAHVRLRTLAASHRPVVMSVRAAVLAVGCTLVLAALGAAIVL